MTFGYYSDGVFNALSTEINEELLICSEYFVYRGEKINFDAGKWLNVNGVKGIFYAIHYASEDIEQRIFVNPKYPLYFMYNDNESTVSVDVGFTKIISSSFTLI